ncbi:MAG: hypothetical protein M3N52_11800 [Actinomycetota bacterium]|nr:hypothetical protein [Actinomycetota bacterium]
MAERPIDESVVAIEPSFQGFKQKYRTGLKAAVAGVDIKANVGVEVDSRGFKARLKQAVQGHGVEAKVAIAADARGWAASVKKELAARRQVTAKVLLEADARRWHSSVAAEMRKTGTSRVTAKVPVEADCRHLHRSLNRCLRLYTGTVKINADVDVSRGGIPGSSRRDRNGGLSGLRSATSLPTLIDFGARGIRPMNLLIGAVVALSPALVAMASSAGLASTSIAALGAAGYGATLGIVGLIHAFSGVTEALKLREAAVKSQRTKAAAAATDEIARQSAIRNAVRSVAGAQRGVADAHAAVKAAIRGVADAEDDLADAQRDAHRAQRDVNEARTEALRDLRELRETVSDLALDEEGAALALERAQERQAEVSRNFWATELERREAVHEVREAEERLSDVQRERAERTRELAVRERQGVEGSERVVNARERAAEAIERVHDAQQALVDQRAQVVSAQERVIDAQLRLTDAQADLVDARRKATAAADEASAAEIHLAAQLAKLSPAARALYDWWVAHEDMFDGMRRKMEQAILPGFLSFLRDVTRRGRDSGSALDIVTDGAAALGRQISRTVARIGKLTTTAWFKGSLVKLNRENEKSFANLGDAVVALTKPLMRIFVTSAPLLTRFTGYIEDLANRFADWIDGFSDAELTSFFRRAGDELAKWWQIVENIAVTLYNIFTASLPTGSNLVGRLRDFTGYLRELSGSRAGQDRIREFFEFFRDLDYGALARNTATLTQLFLAFKLLKMAANHPFLAVLGLLATEFPEQTMRVLEGVANVLSRVIKYAVDNPLQIAALASLLMLMKGGVGKGIGGKFALPGFLGGGKGGKDGKVGTMTVQAAVVNVFGLGGIGGAPGGRGRGGPVPTPVPGGGPTPAPGGGRGAAVRNVATKLGKGGLIATAAYLIAEPVIDWVFGELGNPGSAKKTAHSATKSALAGAGIGGTIGSVIPGVGTAVGAGVGGAIGGTFGALQEQINARNAPKVAADKAREQARKVAEQAHERVRRNTFRPMMPAGFDPGNITHLTGHGLGGVHKRRELRPEFIEQVTKARGKEAETLWDVNNFLKLNNGLIKGNADNLRYFSNYMADYLAARKHSVELGAQEVAAMSAEQRARLGLSKDRDIAVQQYLNREHEKTVGVLMRSVHQTGLSGRAAEDYALKTFGLSSAVAEERDREAQRAQAMQDSAGKAVTLQQRSQDLRAEINKLVGDKTIQMILEGDDKVKQQLTELLAMRLAGKNPNLSLAQAVTETKRDLSNVGRYAGRRVPKTTSNVWSPLHPNRRPPTRKTPPKKTAPFDPFRQFRATGGPIWGAGTETSDSILARLSHGEHVWTAREVRAAGGHHAVEDMRRSVVRGYKRGGEVWPMTIDVGDWPMPDVFGEDQPYLGSLAGLGGKRLPETWQGLWAVVKSKFPQAQLYSAFRPGSRTLSKQLSRHALGKAIDVSPIRAIADWLAATYGSTIRELITPWLDRMIYKGRPHKYSPAVERQHGVGNAGNKHIHLAMAGGGRVGVYDDGGLIPPGVTTVVNGTGGYETLRNPAQERALHQRTGSVRIDRRDLALLAQYIAQAVTGQHIVMDGRAVAETVRGYDHLPRGVW